MSKEGYVCPVCGEHTFNKTGDFEICPVCKWMEDKVQLDNPDEDCCANRMSLNEAREAWKKGEKII